VRSGTPAIVELERAGVVYVVHEFEHDAAALDGGRGFGMVAAEALGVEADRVFKTLLVDVIDSGGRVSGQAVGIVPVTTQLSLKEMAAAVGAKRVEMCDPAAAQRITGYVVGGISPFGQKKSLPTVVDASALDHETIFVSGGKRGLDIEIAPHALLTVLGAVSAAISA
jgi:Cys-tRNA(Pro)/Cys-tRNA(Cys) deacylase